MVNDSSLLVMKMKTENQKSLLENQDAAIGDLNLKLKQSEKKFKNERWQKRLFALGFFAMTIVTILK